MKVLLKRKNILNPELSLNLQFEPQMVIDLDKSSEKEEEEAEKGISLIDEIKDKTSDLSSIELNHNSFSKKIYNSFWNYKS